MAAIETPDYSDDSRIPKTPSFSLHGKRALVTGAGTGLGRASAHALAQAGAELVLLGRRIQPLEDVAAEMQAYGASASCLSCDIRDRNQLRNVAQEWGDINVLVNNAGYNKPQTFPDVSDDAIDDILDLNIRAAIEVAQLVSRQMISRKESGSIINMSSQMGHVGGTKRSLYCASKHAMEGFSKAAAVDMAKSGIRVNTICPTYIETPLTRPFFEDADFKNDVLGRILIGRLGRLEEIMGSVVFLASDASSLITGTSIVVDGGWTAI